MCLPQLYIVCAEAVHNFLFLLCLYGFMVCSVKIAKNKHEEINKLKHLLSCIATLVTNRNFFIKPCQFKRKRKLSKEII